MTGYECMMCMESLESNAPPMIVPENSTVSQPIENNKNVRKSGKTTKQKIQIEDLSEICATPCGHMLHRVCLNRWFKETGKKTCPSCMKTVTLARIIRMFPPRSLDDSANIKVEEGPPSQPNLNRRSIPLLDCHSEGCIDLHEIHKTLINDFNDVATKYTDKVDEVNLLVATNASLEEELARLQQLGVKKTSKRSAPASKKVIGTAKRGRKAANNPNVQ